MSLRPSPSKPSLAPSSVRVPGLLLLSLLALKYLALWSFPFPATGLPNGDAYDYVPKARGLRRTGAFPRGDRTPEPGEGAGALRYPDFRPPGFPVVLALLMAFGEDDPAVTRTARAFDLVLDLAVHLLLFAGALRLGSSRRFRCAAAAILGVQPWTCAFTTVIVPDTSTTLLVVAGTALAAGCDLRASPRKGALRLLAGALLLSATFLLRAEMILFVPLLLLFAVPFRRFGLRRASALAAVAAVPFLLAVLGNVAYRVHLEGRIAVFGEFHHKTPGLLAWTKTWVGGKRAKTRVLWRWIRGDARPGLLPEGAFDGPGERERVEALAAEIRAAGGVSRAVDDAFLMLARERRRRDPLRYYVTVRAFNCGYLWLHGEPPRFVDRLSGGRLRKGLRLLFFALKAALLGLAALGGARLFRALRREEGGRLFRWLAAGLVFGAARTAFFGGAMSLFEPRYVLPAWPFVLLVALLGLAPTPSPPAPRA